MPRIRGKFAPIFDELGEDQRFLYMLNDTEKLLFLMILFTIYTTNGTAPDDHSYYKLRYGLRQRNHTLSTALAHLKTIFPKLVCKNKKLSLLNSVTYKAEVGTLGSLEVEVEEEVDIETSNKGITQKAETANPKFTPPTLIDVVEFFGNTKGGRDMAEDFIDFYSSKGWMVGKNKMKDWQASARRWKKMNQTKQGELPKEWR